MVIISSGSVASLFSFFFMSISGFFFFMDICLGGIGTTGASGISGTFSSGGGKTISSGAVGGGGGNGFSSGSGFGGTSTSLDGSGIGGSVGGGIGSTTGITFLVGALQRKAGKEGSSHPKTAAAKLSSSVAGKV